MTAQSSTKHSRHPKKNPASRDFGTVPPAAAGRYGRGKASTFCIVT